MNDMYNCKSTVYLRTILEVFLHLMRRGHGPSVVVLLILWPAEQGLVYEGGYFQQVVAPLLANYNGRVSHGPSLVAFNVAGWLQRLDDTVTALACSDKNASSACIGQHRGKSRQAFLFKRGRSIHPSHLAHGVIANALAQMLLGAKHEATSTAQSPQRALGTELEPLPTASSAIARLDAAAVGAGGLDDDESAVLRVRLRDDVRTFLAWEPRLGHSRGIPPEVVRDDGGPSHHPLPVASLGPCLSARVDCKAGIAVPTCAAGELLRFNLTTRTNVELPRTSAVLWKSDRPLRLIGHLEDASTVHLEPIRQLSRPCFRTMDSLDYDGKVVTAASTHIIGDAWWLARDHEQSPHLVSLTACALQAHVRPAQLHWLSVFSWKRDPPVAT